MYSDTSYGGFTDDNLGIAFTVTVDEAVSFFHLSSVPQHALKPDELTRADTALDAQAPTLTPKQVGTLNASMASGNTSEALIEERIKDRSAWIAAYNAKSGGGGGGMTSEAALGDRIQVRVLHMVPGLCACVCVKWHHDACVSWTRVNIMLCQQQPEGGRIAPLRSMLTLRTSRAACELPRIARRGSIATTPSLAVPRAA